MSQPHIERTKISKTAVLAAIQDLPEAFDPDELIERIILLAKIEKGMQDFEDGNYFTTDEAKEALRKWLK